MNPSSWTQMAFEVGAVFTPGAPISERELFSGRGQQVGKILDTISQKGYHVVLYGERGVGKTSLSNVLSSFLHGTGHKFLLPRINCDASDTFTSLWKKQFQDIIVTEAKQGIGFSADEIETSRSLVDSLPNELTPDDVRRTLDRLSSGMILVPIFDEFDRLSDNRIPTLMADTIKALSDYSVRATIILIGVADSVEELIREHQSVERALVQVPMPRMSKNEISDIVQNGIRRLNMTITADGLDEIVSLSQGLPYVTHLLALHATKATIGDKRTEVSTADVDKGIGTALDQWQQSIKTSYYNATKSHQPGHIFKEVVLACAFAENDELGYFSAASVREPLRIITGRSYDIPNFARHLKELSESGRGDLLRRTGQKRRLRYRFVSPLMRPYIVMRGVSDGLITRDDIPKLTS